jgi:hypothetical protein
MPGCGIYETVKQAIQDVVAPQLQELKGEIVGLRSEVRQIEKRMEEGFTSVRAEMNVRFGALDEKFTQRIGALDEKLIQRIGAVDQRIDSLDEKFIQRMNSLDEKVTQRLDYTNKRLDEALEIRERLAALEARVAAQS